MPKIPIVDGVPIRCWPFHMGYVMTLWQKFYGAQDSPPLPMVPISNRHRGLHMSWCQNGLLHTSATALPLTAQEEHKHVLTAFPKKRDSLLLKQPPIARPTLTAIFYLFDLGRAQIDFHVILIKVCL
jgi:hypothetical protein